MTFSRVKHFLRSLDAEYFNHLLFKMRNALRRRRFIISLDISGVCNLKCRMCSVQRWRPKDLNPFLPESILDKLLLEGDKLHTISLHCNYEPLLNKNCLSIIQKVKKASPKCYLFFVTNGLLLTPELNKQLLESGLDKLCVSLDGANAATHNDIRCGSDFSQLITMLKDLAGQRETLRKSNFDIEINSVASKRNVNELESIAELACDIGVNTFSINGLEPYSEEMEENRLYANEPLPEYQAVFDRLEIIAQQRGLTLNMPLLEPHPDSYCLINGCVIDTNGDVYPCASLSYKRSYFFFGTEYVHPRVSFGSLKESTLTEIWNSKKFRTFRKNILKGKLPDCCQKCLLRHKVICP